MALKNFLSELTQSSKHKILCTACHSKEEKNDFFCYDCNHIYCNKCINNNHKKHKYISLSKIDFSSKVPIDIIYLLSGEIAKYCTPLKWKFNFFLSFLFSHLQS